MKLLAVVAEEWGECGSRVSDGRDEVEVLGFGIGVAVREEEGGGLGGWGWVAMGWLRT